jgi:hypothetical protein
MAKREGTADSASCTPQGTGYKLQGGSEKMEEGSKNRKSEFVNSYDVEIKHPFFCNYDFRYPLSDLLRLFNLAP